jgi:hypothetical protein
MGTVPSDDEVPLDAEKELVNPAPVVRNMGVPAKARASTANKVTPTVATHNGSVSVRQPAVIRDFCEPFQVGGGRRMTGLDATA